MDTILKVIVLLASAWLAYVVARGERSTRGLSASAVVGIFIALFGSIAIGLLRVESYFTPKMIDLKDLHIYGSTFQPLVTDTGEGSLFVAGLIVLAALVVLALDLLGKVDVMSKLDAAIGNTAHRPSPGAD